MNNYVSEGFVVAIFFLSLYVWQTKNIITPVLILNNVNDVAVVAKPEAAATAVVVVVRYANNGSCSQDLRKNK